MVLIKLAAVLLFIFGAAHAMQAKNLHPFLPNGFPGVLSGAAIVFFTFIGFDSVSTAAEEECERPQRNMPIGIVGTLVVCGILYTSVALVLTGIVNWKTLDNAAPVANALAAIGMNKLRFTVTVGALLGMLSSLLVYQYGQARIWFAMSRDRLLPDIFSKVHKKHATPYISTWIAGLAVGIPAGIWDIGTLADLSNIGTLFAFIIVSAGVVVLRRSQPERVRVFRVPFCPWTPGLSVICCLGLMMSLPIETWIRFVVWLVIGLVIYIWLWQEEKPAAPARALVMKQARFQLALLGVLFVWALTSQISLSAWITYTQVQGGDHIQAPFVQQQYGTLIADVFPEYQQSGLMVGDEVVALDGKKLDGDELESQLFHGSKPNDWLSVTVNRHLDGRTEQRTFTFQLKPHRRDSGEWVLTIMLSVVLPICCLLVGFYIAFARPGDPLAWITLAMLASFSQLTGGATLTLVAFPFRQFIFFYQPILNDTWPLWMILFALYFPGAVCLAEAQALGGMAAGIAVGGLQRFRHLRQL